MYIVNSKEMNLNIILISDIHYSYKVNKNILNKLLNKFKNIQADYICIPGVILDESTDYDQNIYDFFVKLTSISKVIVSLGNHDISKFNKSRMIFYDTKWYEELKDINNLYILNNSQITFGDITFTGYTTLFENDIYNDTPINTLNDLKKFNFIKNKYNILLCHSPQSILGDKKLYENDFIKNQDLILCGHMHNGMVPPIIDNIFKTNTGIIAPGKKLFPKYSRGMFKFNNTTLIICKGITKLAKHSSILRPFNIIYPKQLEKICIKKNDF